MKDLYSILCTVLDMIDEPLRVQATTLASFSYIQEELLESDSDDNEDLHVSQVLSVRGNSCFSNG